MTDTDLYRRAMDLFDEACDLRPDAREALLAERCAGDDALRREVESLLAHDSTAGGALPDSRRGAGADLLAANLAADFDDDTDLPDRVEGYRIIERIGQGGMGTVYEAEQENPRRRVALKLIRSGMVTPHVIRRFQHEAHILGHLQHPGIAHVYEAGSTMLSGARRPFFAMEFIEGLPLDDDARERASTIAQRLELVARVADAVQHAHQKGVIHRDLKPANVLVVRPRPIAGPSSRASGTVIDEIGQPKILDFGVARVVEGGVPGATLQTHPGQIVGTIAYMPPEQIESASDIDTRCDVYALGAILYELLVDKPPHDLAGRPLAEAARIVREREPTRLGAINPALRGDVETIVAKAMQKNRERRYGSAAEFAADIRRHLADEPIIARPPSAMYHMRKFARRNRAVVAGTAAAAFALLAGLGATSYGLMEARRERDAREQALVEERTSRAAADAVTAFFTEMLAAANPAAQGREVTVREAMDLAASRIAGRFDQQPEVEARVRSTIGRTYVALGEYRLAEWQLAAAVGLWGGLAGGDDERLLEAESLLVGALYYQGRIDEAADAAERLLERTRRTLAPDDPLLIEPLSNAAFLAVRSGRFDVAEGRFLEAIAIFERSPLQDIVLVQLKGNLAQLYTFSHRLEEARETYEAAIEFARATIGPDHPETVLLASNLGSVFRNSGLHNLALPLIEETLAAQERLLGPSHSQTLITLNNLADSLGQVGETGRALEAIHEGLVRAHGAYGPESSQAAFLTLTLARVQDAAGQHDEAERTMADALALHERALGPDAEGTFVAATNYLRLLNRREKHAEAADLARGLIDRTIAMHGEKHPRVPAARLLLAEACIGLERYEEAESLLLAERDAAPAHGRANFTAALVRLYEAWGRHNTADRWRNNSE